MKLTALVIDDSRVMRKMVMTSLERANLAEFEFIEAEDGADALNKFDPKTTDIAFVDWNMPKMSGIDFVRKVRSMKNTRHIPLVMVTSEKAMGKVEDALDDAGANSYICKPFTELDMQRKLSNLIKGISERRKKPSGFFGKLGGGGR